MLLCKTVLKAIATVPRGFNKSDYKEYSAELQMFLKLTKVESKHDLHLFMINWWLFIESNRGGGVKQRWIYCNRRTNNVKLFPEVECKHGPEKGAEGCSGWCGSVVGSITVYTERWRLPFLVRVPTQIAGSISREGAGRRQPISVFLSVFPSL